MICGFLHLLRLIIKILIHVSCRYIITLFHWEYLVSSFNKYYYENIVSADTVYVCREYMHLSVHEHAYFSLCENIAYPSSSIFSSTSQMAAELF